MSWRFAKTLREEVLPATALSLGLWADKEECEMWSRANELPKLIPVLEAAKARWRYINYGYQFRFRGKYILAWWPRTQKMLWQGHEKGEDSFLPDQDDVVERVNAFIEIPYLGDLYPDEFPTKRPKRRRLSKRAMLRILEEKKCTT